ncbi:MAG: EAL domain-containing protein [Acetobacteraceae bacterium]|nr:EAL domain-containing protein [Acetobacteraceae bacterium]
MRPSRLAPPGSHRTPGPPAPRPEDGGAREFIEDNLLLLYQPIVRLGDRRLAMVEALARWEVEDLALGADTVVPAAERAGLGADLTAAVARRAALELGRLPGALRLRVSVNMPLDVLERPDIVSWLARTLRPGRLGRGRFVIELTETTPVRDQSRLARSVRRLRQAGCGVLLDDLQLDDGRSHLLRHPFTGVKFDRSVVEALPSSARARHRMRLLAREARRRGMEVTAEGVSSRSLWQALRGAGVTQVQGYHVSRPLRAQDLPAWNARWRGRQLA